MPNRWPSSGNQVMAKPLPAIFDRKHRKFAFSVEEIGESDYLYL
jgi:hypothetical protein